MVSYSQYILQFTPHLNVILQVVTKLPTAISAKPAQPAGATSENDPDTKLKRKQKWQQLMSEKLNQQNDQKQAATVGKSEPTDKCIEIVDMEIDSNSSGSKPNSPAILTIADSNPAVLMQEDNPPVPVTRTESKCEKAMKIAPTKGDNSQLSRGNNSKIARGDDSIAEIVTLNDTMDSDEGIVIVSGSSSEEKVKPKHMRNTAGSAAVGSAQALKPPKKATGELSHDLMYF